MTRLQVAVIGSAGPEEYRFNTPCVDMYAAAEQIGIKLAEQNCIVINGGKGGIMEAVSRGAQSRGGMTVAEVSGNQRGVANKYVDVEVVTGDSSFRGPSQLIGMSDVVISLGGGAGTLQELAVAYRMQKPVVLLVGYGGWTDSLSTLRYLDERELVKFVAVKSVDMAVQKALKLVQLEIT